MVGRTAALMVGRIAAQRVDTTASAATGWPAAAVAGPATPGWSVDVPGPAVDRVVRLSGLAIGMDAVNGGVPAEP